MSQDTMGDFNQARFLEHINHVDNDLRVMALFDLTRSASAGGDVAFDTAVVERALACLSLEEKSEEVRQEAFRAVPALTGVCTAEQQITILLYLLKCATAVPAAPHLRAEYSTLQDLCVLILKGSVSAVAAVAQRDVTYWQLRIPVAERYCETCAEALACAPAVPCRDAIYATLNTLIPLYGRALGGFCVSKLFSCSLSIARACPELCNDAVACCAALAPYAPSSALAEVHEYIVGATNAGAAGDAPALHPLCEGLLRSDPERMRGYVGPLTHQFLATLKSAKDTYEAAPGATDAALRFLLLALRSCPSEVDAQSMEAAVSTCEQLATFDPNYCGDAAAVDAYADDYYEDDYYEDDACGAGADFTWQLRLGALRVLTAVVRAGNGACGDHISRALKAGTAALQDRVQDVQLEGLSLISAAAAQPRCTAGLVVEAPFSDIVALCSGAGDASTLVALRTVKDIFSTVADSGAVLGAVAAGALSTIVKETSVGGVAYTVGAVECSVAVMGALVAAPSIDSAAAEAAVALARSVVAVCTCGHQAAVPRVLLLVYRANASLVRVAERCGEKGQGVAAAAVESLAAIVSDGTADRDCRDGALAALAEWAVAEGVDAAALKAFGALDAALADRSVSTAAAKALVRAPPRRALLAGLPSGLLLHLAPALVEGDIPAGRLVAAQASLQLARAGVPVDDAVYSAWVQAASVAAQRCAPQTRDAGFGGSPWELVAVMLNLLSAALSGGRPCGEDTWAVARLSWEGLAKVTAPCGGFTPALQGLVALTRLVDTPDRHSEVTCLSLAVAAHATLASEKVCLAAIAAIPDAISCEAVGSYLDQLPSHGVTPTAFLLCMGEVGRIAPLPPTYTQQLLESVRDKADERVRLSGEQGLAAAMGNAANSSLLEECRHRALGDGAAGGQSYYLRALRTAIAAAPEGCAEGIGSAAWCKAFATALLATPVEESLVEEAGACVGEAARIAPSACVAAVAEALRSERAELRVLCATALRFILHVVQQRSEADVARVQTLVMDDLVKDLALTASPSIPIKVALLRLLTVQPAWLDGQPKAFAHLLKELNVNAKLVRNVSLEGYTHRVDRGIEMRAIAFGCVAAVMDWDRQRGTRLIASTGAESDLVDALLRASCPADGEEKAVDINNEAKCLLVRFVHQYPSYTLSTDQMDSLCKKVDLDLSPRASADDANKEQWKLLTYTVGAVVALAKLPFFFHHQVFNGLIRRAERSTALPEAMALSIV